MPTRQTDLSPDAAAAARNDLGLTQRQLAEELEIGYSTVQYYERNGAPRLYRFALAGLKLAKSGFLNGTPLLGSGAEDAPAGKAKRSGGS